MSHTYKGNKKGNEFKSTFGSIRKGKKYVYQRNVFMYNLLFCNKKSLCISIKIIDIHYIHEMVFTLPYI